MSRRGIVLRFQKPRRHLRTGERADDRRERRQRQVIEERLNGDVVEPRHDVVVIVDREPGLMAVGSKMMRRDMPVHDFRCMMIAVGAVSMLGRNPPRERHDRRHEEPGRYAVH